MDVNALLTPVIPAFFLLLTTTAIENTKVTIKKIDKIIGINQFTPRKTRFNMPNYIYVLMHIMFHDSNGVIRC